MNKTAEKRQKLLFIKNPFLLFIFDAVFVNACILSTFTVRFLLDVPQRNIEAYNNTWPYITLIYVLVFYLEGLYDCDENDDSLSIFFKVFTGVGAGTICIVALTFISRDFAFPRTVFIISYFMMLLVFSVWRIVAQRKLLQTLPRRNVVIYGSPERMDKLEEYIESDPFGRFKLVRKLPSGDKAPLLAAMHSGEADTAIITDNLRGARSLAFEVFLSRPGAAVYLVPEIYDIIVGALHHTVLGDVPLIRLSQKTILGRRLLLKRVMDVVIALVMFAVGIPFLILAAAATALTSRGPIIFSQERVGRSGRLFRIYKIRTMVPDAEKETGPTLATDDDPRITPVGRVLRRFRVDELPQLINVFLGQMSLVGPRPERPEFVKEFEEQYPAYKDRKKVLPGITGLAQISGLYESDPDMKLKYDLLYIYNYRPLMDIAIMFRTIQHLLRENFVRGKPSNKA